jgi:NAD(P)-dependent dehydrogenase (short-subunit alcohol dehydrogenase family)
MTLRSFEGAVAIVTGGASGIGRGITEDLRKRGATVISADRQKSDADLDVRDAKAFEDLVQSVAKKYGRLDWIFNNAGIAIGAPAIEHSLEDWNHTFDVNVRGVVHGVHAALPIMKEQGFGHIVNTASVAGLVPLPGAIAYTTSKHAVVGLTLALRAEASLYGVRASVLCPGFIKTPILDGGKYGRTAFGAGSTEEIAKKVGLITVDDLVKRVIPRLMKNHAVIVEPRAYRMLSWLARSFPSLVEGRATREYRDRLNSRN